MGKSACWLAVGGWTARDELAQVTVEGHVTARAVEASRRHMDGR